MSSQPTLPKGTDLDSFRNPTPTRKPPKRASAKTRTPSVEDLIDEKLHQKQNVGRVAEVRVGGRGDGPGPSSGCHRRGC